MQNDHSVIISMSEYEKFKEYENQLSKFKENNDKFLEYIFKKLFHAIDLEVDEFVKIAEYNHRTDISSIMDPFKEYLSKLQESGSKKFIDMFLNEEIINKK